MEVAPKAEKAVEPKASQAEAKALASKVRGLVA
jgi:hypothetical protein